MHAIVHFVSYDQISAKVKIIDKLNESKRK